MFGILRAEEARIDRSAMIRVGFALENPFAILFGERFLQNEKLENLSQVWNPRYRCCSNIGIENEK